MPTPRSLETRARAAPAPGDAMLHPAALVGLAALALNDHWGKQAFPGLVTGKLSDVAGMVFFPLLLVSIAEIAQRLAGRSHRPSRAAVVLAVLATGLVFSAIKLSPEAAQGYRWSLAALQWPARAAAALLEGRGVPGLALVQHVVDPTDLLALPALAVPLVVGLRRARRGIGC